MHMYTGMFILTASQSANGTWTVFSPTNLSLPFDFVSGDDFGDYMIMGLRKGYDFNLVCA